MDSNNGNKKWFKQVDGNISDMIQSKGGVIYFPIEKSLYAVDAVTGNEIWKYNGQSTIAEPIGINKFIFFNNLLIVNDKKQIIALNSETGNEIWNFKVDYPTYQLIGGKVYAASKNKLYTLSADSGTILRKIDTPYLYPLEPSIPIQIKSYKNLIFSSASLLFIYDTNREKILWQSKKYIILDIKNDYIYATNRSRSMLYAFKMNKELAWKKAVELKEFISDPVIITINNKYIVIVRTYNVLEIRDAKTGNVINEFAYDGPDEGAELGMGDAWPPELYKDTVFVSTDRTLYAVDAKEKIKKTK